MGIKECLWVLGHLKGVEIILKTSKSSNSVRGKEKLWRNKYSVYHLFRFIMPVRVILLSIQGVNGTIVYYIFFRIALSYCCLVVSIISSIMGLGKDVHSISNSYSYGICWYWVVMDRSKNSVDKSMAITPITLLIHHEVVSIN